jgi:hypothetical protein
VQYALGIRVFRTCGMIDGDIGVWVYEFEGREFFGGATCRM